MERRGQYSIDYGYVKSPVKDGALTVVEQGRFYETGKTLPDFIDHFDTNWLREGLPQDWYNLKKRVGFSMDTQMRLIQGTDYESIVLWTDQTRQDALAFCLEYLSQGLVFPFQYEKTYMGDGQWEYMDKKYQKTILSTVTNKERNGAVARSITRIQDFFLDPQTPDGAMVIMPSPKGPSGLTTDDGKQITYPDSYWFVMEKKGGKVNGFTLKTDMSVKECRAAIALLSHFNIQLSQDAPLEAYNEALIYLDPQQESGLLMNIILNRLKQARNGSPFAFQNRQWDEIAKDVQRRDELYNFTKKTKDIMEEFKVYSLSGEHSVFELRKGLAATLLRLSKLFLIEEEQEDESSYKNNGGIYYDQEDIRRYIPYGYILDEVEKIPGCAGGGQMNNDGRILIESLVPRVATIEDLIKEIKDFLNNDESYSFDKKGVCVGCKNEGMLGPCNLCQGCDIKARL